MTPAWEAWAHPVSFPGDAAARRLRDAGVGRVRLAYAYHSGRWLLTTSRPAVTVTLPAGVWFAPAGDYPKGLSPVRVADDDVSATRAAAAVHAAGLDITAWVVGLHSTPLASARPELALQDVTGARARHALCPARPEVVDYARTLAADAATQPGVTALDLEAFGYLGWSHQGAHEKVGVPLRPVDIWLLSLCFCPACTGRLAAAGVDVDETRRRAATAVRLQVTSPRPAGGDLPALADDILGADVHAAVQEVRAGVTAELVRAVTDAVAAAAAHVRVLFRATDDPYSAAGKTAGVLPQIAASGAGVTVTDLRGDLDAMTADLRAATAAGAAVTVGWSLFAEATPSPRRLREVVQACGESAAIALYCFDLAPAGRWDWLRDDPVRAATERGTGTAGERRAPV